MAGNQDRAAQAEARQRDTFGKLKANVDSLIPTVAAPEATDEQVSEAGKRAGENGVVARTL